MPTDVYWNKAKPPRSEGEHASAGWLASIARQVGITTVTEANKSEWLWRFAFSQEMSGRRFGSSNGYERDIERLRFILDRFRTTRLEGRVVDQNRDEFVEEFIASVIESAREQADAAIEEDCNSPA